MFITVDIWTVGRTDKGMAVLLRIPASPYCVPIYIEPEDAHSVLSALSGVRESPPRLPEFLVSFSAALSARPESVEIFKGDAPGKYRSIVHFTAGESCFALDSRIADALATAVRAGIPILLEDDIRQVDGVAVALAEPEMPVESQLACLQGELHRRVNEEDYEQAASIRDQIRQIEERMGSDSG